MLKFFFLGPSTQNCKDMFIFASFFSHLSFHFPTAVKFWSAYLVHSLHFLNFWFYITLTAPTLKSSLSTLCRFCIMAQDESQSNTLICFSGSHPNCFGQAHHGCLCQRSFCCAMIQKAAVENIHALKGTQVQGYNTERQHLLLTVSLWAPQQGQASLYIGCQTHKQHQKPFQGQWRGFMGCTVRVELELHYCCQYRKHPWIV